MTPSCCEARSPDGPRSRCGHARRGFARPATSPRPSWRAGRSEEDREVAVLIVNELATNAVRHGRSDLTVALALAGATLHIDVTDRGEPSPPPGSRLRPANAGAAWKSSAVWPTGPRRSGSPGGDG
ncbi:ATP-binding protein [Streptomyces sp. NPDC004250]|uniref:ATP-binding protein n=1 Tax=Streptomyces sp. NPDC004250 TaxID=3364692 RepID=UPI003692BF8B